MMILEFGRYCVELIGSDLLIGFLQHSWKNYLAKGTPRIPDFTIFVEEMPSFDDIGLTEGWNETNFQGETIHVYSARNKAVFAVHYRPKQKNATVYVREDGRSVRLGVQFGTLDLMHHECIGLHGVTLVCGNEIMILSAPSGTGKTTLAKLLEEYCDAVIINGDFALLNPTEEGVILVPTPFCGSSGRCLNYSFKIIRIVFLEQAKENNWFELNGREAMQRLLSNSFVPEWDMEMQEIVRENAMKCISSLHVNAYAFAPTQEAAETFYKHIRT